MKHTIAGIRKLLAGLFLMSLLSFCPIGASAAPDDGISLNVKDRSITWVLEQLNKDFSLNFVLLNHEIDVDRKVSINLTDASLAEVMKAIFPDGDVSWEVMGNTVRIMKKENSRASSLSGQNVSGKITDGEGEPLVGAYILEKGTSNGAIADLDGNYSIALEGSPEDAILTFSYVGYLTRDVQVSAMENINVALEEDTHMLEGVVVMGYGVQRKGDITGAVSTVQARSIEDIPVNNFGAAIAGRTAGVQVVSPSGKPSGGFSVRVRGATSITAGNEPLYVVDGVPTTDTYSINPEEIESITVLKDASSAAIYGSAGANGVVLITTKSGNREETTVEFNAYFGF